MSEETAKAESSKSLGDLAIPFVVVALLGFAAFQTSWAFLIKGYTSGDSCWLIRMGQIISETGVPKSDPFTFTLPMMAQSGHAQLYVVHQWLSEWLFYQADTLAGLIGPLVLCAMIMNLTLPCLCLRLCIRAKAPVIWSLLAVLVVTFASQLRCIVRPEVFSFLGLTLCFLLLQRERASYLQGRVDQSDPDSTDSTNSTDSSEPSDSKSAQLAKQPAVLSAIHVNTVWQLACLMIVWANLHTGFVLGCGIIFIYGIAFAIEDRLLRRTMSIETKTLLVSAVVASIATLLNPSGLDLWRYIPEMFFGKFNEVVSEMKPLTLEVFADPYFRPSLFVPLLAYGTVAVSLFKNCRQDRTTFKSLIYWLPISLIVLATAMCLRQRRLVPIAAIMMLIESANLIGAQTKSDNWHSFWKTKLSVLALEGGSSLVVLIGLFSMGYLVPTTIPVPTTDFQPPLRAIEFLVKNAREGNISTLQPSAMSWIHN